MGRRSTLYKVWWQYGTSDEKFGEIWQKVVKFGAINERIGADEAKNFTAFFMNLPYKFKLALFNLSSCKGAVSCDKNYVLEK